MTDEMGHQIRDLLPERLENMADCLKDELGNIPAAGGAGLAWGFLASQAGEALGSVLDTDLIDVLVDAWSKTKEIHEYTDAARHPPTERSAVTLSEHSFTKTLHPVLEYRVAEATVQAVKFDLELTAEIQSIMLSIKNGYITAIGNGSARVALQLKYHGRALHKAVKTRQVKLYDYRLLREPGWKIV